MSETIYLITGANRGIGKGLLETLAARPNTTVIAAVRDVSSALTTFKSVPLATNSKIITIKIDSTSETDPATAVSELATTHHITKLDVLISNAGLLESDAIVPVLESSPDAVRRHFEVNTIAPFLLFKAFHPLLLESSHPRFFTLTSILGSIGSMENYNAPFFSYGVSKSAANFLVRKIACEVPEIITVAFNPGWVKTDMGNDAARVVGMVEAPVEFGDSIRDLLKLFDGATKGQSGTFLEAATGAVIPW
ncbi:hypothetical protein SBOR_2905 [Sclerotinia borealis F-4128]|uniref:Aflatoxin biosynthesis ketoreductase nor-1 n=1 Tax=Sclerotinia borealis (strain F-4128) TaxID=1432307 RepID=W9CIW7_SCLBF|nr:hypothetical protein SBOR_2905 [Sclerotinia borealis F-4128]